ncbi:polyprenol monophosphomannose synthase [Candidatus Sumerlaeota bacterium]|nr:polyprenol monophosphomannose synthase [Candidatus Sumerlaeota bacterium]
MQRALVIIPTYNEIENIERLIGDVLTLAAPDAVIEVLVVDDASTDGTTAAVERLAQNEPRAHLLARDRKYGLGTAYIAGFRYALEHGYDLAATMDADFSHSPGHLPEMLAAVARADVVIGSRYVPGGGIRNWGLHRHILSGVANFLARLVGGLKPHDCTTGYRLYRTDFLRRLDLDRITSHGYSCLMELVFVCQRAGARIEESPIVFCDRRAGQSKISRGEIFRAFKTLWHLARLRCRGGTP